MNRTTLLLASLLTSTLLVGCSDDDDGTTPAAVFDSFPAEGALLPFQVLRDDLIDGKTQQSFEVRNGGFGSAMTAHPSSPTRFYALTDRGPNASFTGDHGKGKVFPTPDYTPRIGLFEVQADGVITHLNSILLKRPDGSHITGLPNTSALGGTGETPYHASGEPVLVDDSQPYDETTNPLRLDDYGLDGEGLVALSDGTFWVSDEYGPHMVHFDAEGREIGRINPFADDSRVSLNLPAEFANRRANRGMEGLAVTPDETTLVGIMQSTMYNPGSAVKDLDITRLVTVNLETGAIGQYLYRQQKTQNSNSEILALSDTEFLVLERDGSFLYGGPNGAGAAKPDAQKQVYRIDLSSGTNLETIALNGDLAQNPALGLTLAGKTLEEVVLEQGWGALTAAGIVPVSKSLVVDMVAEVNYPHDKMEGLWLIDNQRLGVLNDDDFATWSSGGVLEQKMLDANTVDGNRLYIINADLSVD
ncbi:esterase-like activity of phytase family protein [Marinobacter xestospongiae]|uniref:esterase-like activity of phytase family protein n=1 Tax=Marinobacter xestospongiae TaxID=994319 RepID=UPI0020046ABE|nr:esterase-like activity of phytase family protein [Marinobacter xestospongiae]MCK7565166.1 esterase-like activity of phytase family protein [Marinobacter xestospongiae]